MNLPSRIFDYKNLSSRFPCSLPSKLIAVHQIRPDLWENLRVSATVYMSKCLGKEIILDEKELIQRFEKERGKIPNITPNGMIVPKRYLVVEYNLLVKSFIDIVNSLNINDFILSWHVPLNLRIKYGQVNEENLKRHHPTEDIHSDSWAGESHESVTTHIPILGDISKNYFQAYDPPENFEESWLGPLPTYRDGAKYAQQYKKLDLIPQPRDFLLADFATLHSTTRLPNAGSRVSIDTTFHMKHSEKDADEKIHPWRAGERASHEVLSTLGEKHLLYFPDGPNDIVDSQGGFKHATNLQIRELETKLPSKFGAAMDINDL